jgi:DNA-binding LacI/PurR family transcriptional regulator
VRTRTRQHPTIKDVAELAQVSPATVSSVLRANKNVSDISRQKVLDAINELGYRPNRLAQALRTQRSRTLGLVIPDIANPFYADIAQGATDQARASGYGLFLMTASESETDLRQAAEELVQRQVDGLLLTSVGIDYRVSPWRLDKVPYVLVNRYAQTAVADYVGIDNRAGAREVVRFLHRLGHRHIAFIGGLRHSSASRDRLAGFHQAMQELGLVVSRDHMGFADLQYDKALNLTQEMLQTDPRPSALFAADDMMALGAWEGAQLLGVRVPAELTIVGFDGIWNTALAGIRLSTVVQPRYELGHLAVKLLHERIQGFAGPPRVRLLPYEFAARSTTGPAPRPACSFH